MALSSERDAECELVLHSQETAANATSKPANSKEPVTDSAFGIMIVFASFCCGWIIGVMFIAFSILYSELKNHFDSTYNTIGWVGSLYLASGNVAGIVFSVFIKRYGCRVVAVIGGLVWAAGFALSGLISSVYSLYVTYGLIAGSGFNMITLCSFVIVQQHFVKFRAVAAGIAATGISIGSLSSGPVIKLLIDGYGWRGTFIIMAAITMQGAVLGSIFRPPATRKRSVKEVEMRDLGEHVCESNLNRNDIKICDNNEKRTEVNTNGVEFKSTNSEEKCTEKLLVDKSRENCASHMNSAATTKTSSAKKTNCCGQMLEFLRDTFNVSIFRNTAFALCCCATFFMNFGATIFFQHTPSRARFLEISRTLAFLLPTVVGVATAIARLSGGVIGNLKCTNRTLQYGVTIILAGVLMFVTANVYSFVEIAAFSSAIGALIGLSLTVQTTVMTDLVGVENIARAQAFILVFTGVAALVAVPVAGVIVDETKNYSYPFYLGGLMQIIGGCLTVATAVLQRKRNKKNKNFSA